ncbi:unnamed protein product [Rhizoctonia solani]|uniref:Uncharacterized protein n=1 Tax=Rhizoctonia solani TaxID=456999 RepID=A0A8H3D668_9AGAM|nr:unnamed protein product [Rhizoctonia solani]
MTSQTSATCSPISLKRSQLDVEDAPAKDEPRSTISKGGSSQPGQRALAQRPIDRWTILPNLQDPKSYRRLEKAGIVFVVALASFAGPFASNSLQPAFPELQRDWNIPDTVVALTTTLFLCATGIAPLWYAFLSERQIWSSTYLLIRILDILIGFSGMRPFNEYRHVIDLPLCTSSWGELCAERGTGYHCGYLCARRTWESHRMVVFGTYRWAFVVPSSFGRSNNVDRHMEVNHVQRFNVIFGGVLELLIVLFLPETSTTLKAKQAAALSNPAPEQPRVSKQTLSQTCKSLFQLFIIRPFNTVLFIRFLPVGLTVYYGSTCFACLYSISTAIPFSFEGVSPIQGMFIFNSMKIALTYIPPCLGYIIGSITGGYLSDYMYRRARARDGDSFAPESRLNSAWFGVPFMPIGLLIFGWTLHTHQKWMVPLVGGFIFGIGFMLGTGTCMAYFADVIPGQSASVVACFNLCRNIAAALSAALAAPAINKIGQGWYFTIMAALVSLMSLNLLAVRRWGNHWRQQREEDTTR